MLDQRLQEHGGAQIVDRDIAVDRIHALADTHFGREVDELVDADQSAFHEGRVAHVAVEEFDMVQNGFTRCTRRVNLVDQAV